MIAYRSIADLNETIIRNMHRVPRDIDLVVGIPRSGLLAANILALHLNLPLTDLDGFLAGRLLNGGVRTKKHSLVLDGSQKLKVLVIDDSLWSGNSIQSARSRIESTGVSHNILYGAVFVNPTNVKQADLWFEKVRPPRVFEWNIMHCAILERSCVDIDGVLCRDPTPEENDDGPKYEEFLRTAEPLLLPTVPVGWLVTCRLEKYRRQTEQWLTEHGVQYGELVMMDLPSKEARIASGSHARFKAEVFKATDAMLFLESSARQAQEIAVRAGKSVFCLETRRMEQPGLRIPNRSDLKRALRWCYRKARGTAGRVVRTFVRSKRNNPDDPAHR